MWYYNLYQYILICWTVIINIYTVTNWYSLSSPCSTVQIIPWCSNGCNEELSVECYLLVEWWYVLASFLTIRRALRFTSTSCIVHLVLYVHGCRNFHVRFQKTCVQLSDAVLCECSNAWCRWSDVRYFRRSTTLLLIVGGCSYGYRILWRFQDVVTLGLSIHDVVKVVRWILNLCEVSRSDAVLINSSVVICWGFVHLFVV